MACVAAELFSLQVGRYIQQPPTESNITPLKLLRH